MRVPPDLFVFLTLGAMCFGNARLTVAESRDITKADRVIAIYTEDWGLPPASQPQLVFCAWGDGVVVWSLNQIHGGAPYHTANTSPDAFAATVRRLESIGVFRSPQLERAKFGLHSRFTTIVIRDGDKEMRMQSWHELSESGGHTISGDEGVEPLAGQPLLSALKDEPKDYLVYRLAWLEVRLAAAQLIPSNAAAIKGRLSMHHAVASWVTSETAKP